MTASYLGYPASATSGPGVGHFPWNGWATSFGIRGPLPSEYASAEADLPIFEVHSHRKEMDLEGRRWRVEQFRTGHFLTGNPVIEQPLTQAADGNVAFDVQPNGTPVRLSAQVGRERHAQFFHHPVPLLQALLQGPSVAAAENLREEESRYVMDVRIVDGPKG